MKVFKESDLGKLTLEPGKQVIIIGGSNLFHGAPLLSLKVASRIVSLVFFASPVKSHRDVAAHLKSELSSFIWIPWREVGDYIEKSDAVLIGPGFMRAKSEKNLSKKECDEAGRSTRETTENLLKNFPNRKWVIDAGSLQLMNPNWIPKGAILTPSKREYEMLFGDADPQEIAEKYNCTILLKGKYDVICSPTKSIKVEGGNWGMRKGGMGDVLAGLVVGLLASNGRFISASSASYLAKRAGEELFKKNGSYYNADDLASELGLFLPRIMR
ncbi:MAG: Carbohydrate kinase, YjeF related protein [Candidatus Woesebacteria bacterium GW2011_GWB1_43_14]|uniref:ADP-dependent (S)-NAD(P)H-hydrate dehydratase n=1 Tax=Candidatus Woesebacteria bacterium GW2011_GWB1_43_14 TaxID=1618578 RepID=A0A0G1DMR6_9BACT|nr:MAG: Carbohydrate kinase, YjeF related protein [Candidatus Woesebacteria bacterium GW2011_GWC1_42_9]KKS98862.1 MAG: Carbohydrate kinase, YjeF related protein [Candidatus Woesebacteria bacterium GW2011_GWB1_43_14]